jgi:hypothetical protein
MRDNGRRCFFAGCVLSCCWFLDGEKEALGREFKVPGLKFKVGCFFVASY